VGFKSRLGMAVTGFVLLWSSLAGAQEASRITVLVIESVDISSGVLRRAETEASNIFHEAGIEIEWVNCTRMTGGTGCRTCTALDCYVLHIVATGTTRSDSVFGEAFLGEDGRGKYSDIFFERVAGAEAVSDMDVGRLLGAVSAHELGHLLLGTHAHAVAGVMEPIWARDCLRRIGMGSLLFTPGQARLMKARIGSYRAGASPPWARTRNRWAESLIGER